MCNIAKNMATRIAILLCMLLTLVTVEAVNQENFYPFGEGNRDDYIQRGNDVSSPAIELRGGMPFYNVKYWSLFVNDNGVISFNNPYTKYEGPQPVFPIPEDKEDPNNPLERILIAPYWANVDMTERGYVYYRQTTEEHLLERAAGEIHKGFVEFRDFMPKVLVIATWLEVGFYGDTGQTNPKNSFQCVIATDEFETFVLFIYDLLEWTTGTESNGQPETGVGGTPAQVGFNAGDGSKARTHFYSRDSNKLPQLVIESNIEITGVWLYHVSSVSIDEGGCTTAGLVKTFPRFDSMLGHQYLFIQGPCFKFEEEIWLRFGPEENPITITNCTYMSAQEAWCVVPTFYQVGRVETYVSNNGAITFPYTGTFDVVDIGDVPPTIKRISPQSESWLFADRPVAIEWDPSLINYTMINIDVLTYTESDGSPSWEETEDIESNVPNTGRYEWIPRANGNITEENAVGVIRITMQYKRDQVALWSDVHYMGYMMNDKYQKAPAVYASQRCEDWYEDQIAAPVWNYTQDLNPCPCDLSQAMADRARFRPLDKCDMTMAGEDDDEDYCYLREGIKHCVIDIINSPQKADSVCCYDYEENLVYSGDSYYGSFSHRTTTNGVPPYNSPGTVPQMSTWLNDIIPYYTCCIIGDLCEYYQQYRPTRDCRWYGVPRVAVIFGDPHIVTFDGVEYTFNGKGEYILMQSTNDAQNRFVMQGRTEQMPNWEGDIVRATRLTSIVMKEEDGNNIEIQHSSKTVLQVVYQWEYLKIDTQTRLRYDGFYLTFPKKYEGGNVTQVVVTFQDSKIGVVINGTAEGMFVQVIIPDEFKNAIEGLFGNCNDFPDDDLTSVDGTMVSPNASTEEIYNNFGKSWAISSPESLFLYEQGKNHDYYQDDDFVPVFETPEGSLPPNLNASDVMDVCGDNVFCIYDVQSTGLIQLGKATKQAYDDYKRMRRAPQDKSCGRLDPPNNGSITLDETGQVATFGCDEGFFLSGSEQSECLDGQWSSETPSCIKSCGRLDPPNNGFITLDETGQVATFGCDEGFFLSGSGQSECLDGQWSSETPSCIKSCGPLDPPNNGFITLDETGQVATFGCDEGFSLSGSGQSECLDGQWSSETPSCITGGGVNVVGLAVGLTIGFMVVIAAVIMIILFMRNKNKSSRYDFEISDQGDVMRLHPASGKKTSTTKKPSAELPLP